MQLPTFLGRIIKSGQVTVYTGNERVIEINAENNQIDLNIENKAFVKDVIGSIKTDTSNRGQIEQVKGIAIELKEEGLTFIFSYKGNKVVTVGYLAKPKFSKIITRTSAIEINSISKLIEIGL